MKIINEIFRPAPQILYLEPYFGCNYRCLFCIHGSGPQFEAMSLGPSLFEKLKPLIRTVKHVHITGLGEPFLNPHLLDYLSYFREQDKSYYINTNGSLIDDAHIDVMTTSKSELSVSLDAGDRETYEKIRRQGKWDTVISGIRRVSKIKSDLRRPYPLLYLTFHINALNLMSLKKVPQLAADLGIDAVKLSWTMLPEAHRDYSIFKSRDLVEEIVSGVCAQLRNVGIDAVNEAVFGRRTRRCWAFSPMFFVGAGGAVAACCNRWPTIGNINDNHFQDIRNGMIGRRILLGIVNGKPEEPCKDCPQIRGSDNEENEAAFLKPRDLDAIVLSEKTKRTEKAPSLEGLDAAFRSGVSALLAGRLHDALSVFSALDEKFPDFFEIKNNLAATYYYLGAPRRSREIFNMMKMIPHNEEVVRYNLMLPEQLGMPAPHS
jgi:MoaA/NifB/PqqE/SkfB family radical SAM enzyme